MKILYSSAKKDYFVTRIFNTKRSIGISTLFCVFALILSFYIGMYQPLTKTIITMRDHVIGMQKKREALILQKSSQQPHAEKLLCSQEGCLLESDELVSYFIDLAEEKKLTVDTIRVYKNKKNTYRFHLDMRGTGAQLTSYFHDAEKKVRDFRCSTVTLSADTDTSYKIHAIVCAKTA